MVKCDKNLGPAIIEHDVYTKRVCRDHNYQRDTYLYLPSSLAVSKMEALKLKVRSRIKQHSEQLTRMGKLFLDTNLKANVDPFPWFYGMIKIHKTQWAIRPIISCTGSLMHTIGIRNDSKLKQVAADIPA